MSGAILSETRVLIDPEVVTRLFARFQAAVLSVNDRCGDTEHRAEMRRTIFDQSELLMNRICSQ